MGLDLWPSYQAYRDDAQRLVDFHVREGREPGENYLRKAKASRWFWFSRAVLPAIGLATGVVVVALVGAVLVIAYFTGNLTSSGSNPCHVSSGGFGSNDQANEDAAQQNCADYYDYQEQQTTP